MPLVTFDHDFATFFGRSVAIAHAVSARRALLDAETVFSALDRALGYPGAISGTDAAREARSGFDQIEALYRAQWPTLLRLAYFLVGDRATAEDLVQDAFLRLERVRHVPEHPEAYLRTVLVTSSATDVVVQSSNASTFRPRQEQ